MFPVAYICRLTDVVVVVAVVVVAVVVVVVIVGGGVVTFYFHCYLTHDLQDVQRAMQLKVFSLPLPPSHVT